MSIDHNIPNHYSSDFRMLARDLMHDRVLLITNRAITIRPHLYGEDYYIYTLLLKLKERGVSADIAALSKNAVQYYGRNGTKIRSLKNIIKSYNAILLFNVSPIKLLTIRFTHKLKLIMLVFFLWNKDYPLVSNIRNLVGDTLWQLVVDQYIATSPRIARGLKHRGILKKIYLIPPVYQCKYCNSTKNAEKLEKLRKRLPQRVKAVYIGALNPVRAPIFDVIGKFNVNRKRMYEVNIYTATPAEERTKKIGNVEINVFSKILSDKEKCNILCASHVFIAPRHGTTMDPSISAMEAEYHGNIVIRI